MKVNGSAAVYRFIVKPNTANDPRSLGYLADTHSLSLYQITQIKCQDLYFVRGGLDQPDAEKLAAQLLHDPVTQSVEIDLLEFPLRNANRNQNENTSSRTIEVALRPGVTDPVAEQIVRAGHLLGIPSLESACTGLRFILTGGGLTDDLLHLAAKRLLSNAVIQTYALGEITPTFSTSTQSHDLVETIHLRGLDDAGLLAVSSARRAALNLAEMHAIQDYCMRENRDLTDIEFEMLAQTWSEHCVHKTFKSQVSVYSDKSDTRSFPAHYSHLFNQTIRAATKQVNADWVLSAFTENAGIVEFDGTHELSFKVETHNHPSAIEPFGGANTGIGGVIRDVIGVSAKPIASTDVLCFGPAELPLTELPEGVLHPRRIASGVVAGIQDYGNKMGIPTVNGAIWYDPDYVANPLVFCGSVGLAPKGSNPHATTPGDHIIVLGGRTGRDGLRGATFSSMTMDAQTGEVSGASVQIGAPVIEKGLVDVLTLARDRGLYNAITDCGAGGLSSAVGEMASEQGGDVQLMKVLLKYPGLAPWEIWLSEAQERMVIAVPGKNLNELADLCSQYEVEMTDIGNFTDTGRMRVFHGANVVLDLDNEFLHHGIPQRHYSAVINKPRFETGQTVSLEGKADTDLRKTLLKLLAHSNIASKERTIRDYDHEVQGGTVVKPLCGLRHDGPSDGSVIKPLASQTNHAFVLSNGLNPEYGKIDPYQMTWLVIDEAFRNAVACGADPSRIAILDNFCWGDPTRPEIMGDLVQSAQACFEAAVHYETPFISGKDSFNNEYLGSDGKIHAIPPTLLISALGVMPDWQQSVTMDFKHAGSLIYLIGDFAPAFGGSHFNLVDPNHAIKEGLPHCSKINPRFYLAFYKAIQEKLVSACHDLSEGGLAVATAEMCMAGRLGALMQINATDEPLRSLFGETSGCFLVEVTTENKSAFEDLMSNYSVRLIGKVESHQNIQFDQGRESILNISITDLLNAWKNRKIAGGLE
ncbi:MAG: phosphoribosylformylglycinamidine synthase subunit PurL [Chloroflexi bacterium HGW-Chloroflexi-4]|jgi:phosphoribosylformylglycinamidine synthase|nr:MAG: phosphoribosylformylglycinamidine synthase subunit PurL [Chloroflexi bacterium HGW-Chloroflexi-4]